MMRVPNRTRVQNSRGVAVALLALGVVGLGACELADGGGAAEGAASKQAALTPSSVDQGEAPRLGTPKRVAAVAGESFLVSPRWAPSGEWIVFKGKRGRGLFVRRAFGGRAQVVDGRFQGRVWWDSLAGGFCARGREGEVEVLNPGEARLVPLSASARQAGACRRRRRQGRYGVVVHEGAYGRILNHPRRGTLHVDNGPGEPEAVTAAGAWGVEVSPLGRRVAYCSGPLSEPELHVYDLVTRRHISLGRGVHPEWTPDGEGLLFARPEGTAPLGGLTVVTRSDLFYWSAEKEAAGQRGEPQVVRLTHTPQVAEMQPALSPDGQRVVFCDWWRGGLYEASWSPQGRWLP